MTSATTTERLLRLLSLLQSRRDWPGSVLADRLGISHRTVRRDVERLRELGYSIRATMGPDGGYRLDAGDHLPPLLFDDDQVVAIAVALQTASASGIDIAEGASRALGTVRQVMPSRLRHRLDGMRFTAMPSSAESVAPEVLVALTAAVRANETLRFDYEGTAPRRVEPHHVVTVRGRWYLVAWDLDKSDWRIFRADRIAPRTPTRVRFAPRALPGASVHEFVAARFKGAETDAWPCRGTVVLECSASEVAPFAADGTVVDLGDGRCSLELGAWSWVALAASFARFDAPIEVVGPPQLSAAFGELAARFTRAHTLSS